MTPQELKENSQELETRVVNLEKELAQVKQMLARYFERKEPWWLKVAGSFEQDTNFDEAVCLGQKWRKSAENEVYLSVVSVWECIIKYQLGKLPLPDSPEIYLPISGIKGYGFWMSHRAIIQNPKSKIQNLS